MLKLHRMNSKTKKGIIIDKKTFVSIRNKFDNWRHMNIKGPYTVFIFENIASIDKKTNPGLISLNFIDETGNKFIHKYKLSKRRSTKNTYDGFNNSDVVYLITPDRFSNGDESNDSFNSLKEKIMIK